MKDEAGRPMIFCGTKGMVYVELVRSSASHDLHAWRHRLNPAWRQARRL